MTLSLEIRDLHGYLSFFPFNLTISVPVFLFLYINDQCNSFSLYRSLFSPLFSFKHSLSLLLCHFRRMPIFSSYYFLQYFYLTLFNWFVLLHCQDYKVVYLSLILNSYRACFYIDVFFACVLKLPCSIIPVNSVNICYPLSSLLILKMPFPCSTRNSLCDPDCLLIPKN